MWNDSFRSMLTLLDGEDQPLEHERWSGQTSSCSCRNPCTGTRPSPSSRGNLGFPTRADRAANPGVAPVHCGRCRTRPEDEAQEEDEEEEQIRLPEYANEPLISPNATPPVTYSRLQGVTSMPKRARIEESDFCLTEPENWSVRSIVEVDAAAAHLLDNRCRRRLVQGCLGVLPGPIAFQAEPTQLPNCSGSR